jgi:hypothetical protein
MCKVQIFAPYTLHSTLAFVHHLRGCGFQGDTLYPRFYRGLFKVNPFGDLATQNDVGTGRDLSLQSLIRVTIHDIFATLPACRQAGTLHLALGRDSAENNPSLNLPSPKKLSKIAGFEASGRVW